MKGTIEKIDSYFTNVRLDNKELRLFNHKGANRVEGFPVGQRVEVDIVRQDGPLFGLEVVGAARAELKVPIRKRS